jgi:two-component system CheB/CheR fusion protein
MLKQYIIAIAGSAGILEPLKEFFDHTPLNNASYIILRHLPIGFQSTLDQLLKKHCKLEIAEARKDESIENDRIYYAPPNDFLEITDGSFALRRRTGDESNPSIDIFLKSLAKNENKRKAIAVILSGTGNDGLKGVAEIRKSGGLIIVQSPDSCEYPQLPEKIIEKGYADFVLDPGDMPIVIQGHVNRFLHNNIIK